MPWVKRKGLVFGEQQGIEPGQRRRGRFLTGAFENLRAVQLLLGHTKLKSTVRYLGFERDDALEMSEQTEVGDL